MPTVTFIGTGDRTDDHTCTVFGADYQLNVPVEMDEVPAKLVTNPTFRVEGLDEKPAKRGLKAPPAEPVVEG